MENQEKQFLQIVQAMRNAQKKYFSTKSKQALAECKRLEQQCDKLLTELTTETPTNHQSEIFK